jgi:hypothetical protein
MATISFSTAYVSAVTSDLTKSNPSSGVQVSSSDGASASASAETTAGLSNILEGSLFAPLVGTSSYQSFNNYRGTVTAVSGSIVFQNSSNQTLVSYTIAELTKSMDANGYVIIANFPPKIPSLAGTISTMILSASDSVNTKTITFSIGAPSGGADIQFDDRDLVTSQPWRLDGNIKFRVPVSYEYTV